MYCDLHCHTNHSDGALSPRQLIAMAEETGINALSFTDHDTVNAYLSKPEYPLSKTLRIIPGVEFSTVWRGIGIHIVGLDINPKSTAITEGVRYQQQARENRAQLIAQKLERLGVLSPYTGALKYAKDASLGRPHFAKHLVATGFCKDLKQAFRKHLGAGKVGDVKQEWATMSQVISWIRDGNGISILAHPHHYKLTRTKLNTLVDEFIHCGGQGLEVLSGQQKQPIVDYLADITEAKGIVASLGSDFHKPNQHRIKLGMHKTLPSNCRPVWDLF
jgi:predicted metal-dependent phosphoesterase TrpH